MPEKNERFRRFWQEQNEHTDVFLDLKIFGFQI